MPRNNRNPMKQYFYTFPQTTVTKIEFRDALQKIHTMKYYKIVQETHEDGGKHLHAVVVAKKPIAKSKILKALKEIYPKDNKRIDVQPTRSPKDSIAYLSKEDTCPLESAEKYVDPRNPRNSFILSVARQWGFPSVETFNNHMRQQYERQNEIDNKMLHIIFELEQRILNNTIDETDPEIQWMKSTRERYLYLSGRGFTISKDDMTKFKKLAKKKLEIV